MAWSNLANRTDAVDTFAAADINTLMENCRVIGGNGTTAPTGDVTDHEDRITALELSSANAPDSRRQTVQYSGASLAISSGLSVTNTCTAAEPLVVNFSNGNKVPPYDYTSSIQSNLTWSGLTANANPYLYLDRASDGTITTGSTPYTPVYNTTFKGVDAGAVCATFEGSNGATTYTDLTGNACTLSAANATISTARSYSGTSSLRLAGTNSYAQVDFPTYTKGKQWTIRGKFYFDAIGVLYSVIYTNVDYQGFLVQRTAANKLAIYISSNGSTWDIVNGAIGTTTIAAATWYDIEVSWDGATYRLYCGTTGTNTLEWSLASTTAMFQSTVIRLGAYPDVSTCMVGNIDDFQILPYCAHTSTWTIDTAAPAAPTLHYFNTDKMTMYSGNPTVGWTQCNKVFRGECVTGASTVTSVVTYAPNGRAVVTGATALVASTAYTLSHNIGCTPWNVTTEWVCKVPHGAFRRGDIIRSWGSNVNLGSWTTTYATWGRDDGYIDRLSNIWITGGGYAPYTIDKTGTAIGITYASWIVQQRVDRGW